MKIQWLQAVCNYVLVPPDCYDNYPALKPWRKSSMWKCISIEAGATIMICMVLHWYTHHNKFQIYLGPCRRIFGFFISDNGNNTHLNLPVSLILFLEGSKNGINDTALIPSSYHCWYRVLKPSNCHFFPQATRKCYCNVGMHDDEKHGRGSGGWGNFVRTALTKKVRAEQEPCSLPVLTMIWCIVRIIQR